MTARINKRKWIYNGKERSAYQVRYIDPETGKRTYKTFDREKDARDFAKTCEILPEGAKRAPRAKSGLTIADMADIWIKACEEGTGEHEKLEAATLRQYQSHVNTHIIPMMGDRLVAGIDVDAVKEFRDDLVKKVSRVQAKKVLQSFSSILNEAKDRGVIKMNPAREVKVKISAREKARVQIPSQEEMRVILARASELAAQGNKQRALRWKRYRAMIVTKALTGLRASEIRGLPWSNVDLENGLLHVRQRADETGRIGRPKSVAGERAIILAREVVAILKDWRTICPQGPLGLVFPNWEGHVELLANIHRRGWYPLLERAGIVDDEGEGRYTFHALRHFRASILIARGATPKEIMTEMGHSSINVTFNIYGHLFPEGEAQRRQRAQEIAQSLVSVDGASDEDDD